MKRIIKIDLSAESIDQAVEEINQLARTLNSKLDEICRRLAEVGIQEANAQLVLASGNTDAFVEGTPVKTANGYKIVMSGTDVYFVEFGTGDSVNAHGYTVSVPVYGGSYSETHKQNIQKYGFWWYGGEQLTGTPAYMPMYNAGKAIRDAFPKIVEEVFSK